jgi:hypothetical protein
MDSEILQRPPINGQQWWAQGRARCRHCRLQFHFRELPAAVAQESLAPPVAVTAPAIDYQTVAVQIQAPQMESTRRNPMLCPECGGKGLVTSTQGRDQYRKCKGCGHRYKTLKVVY